jgi:hypothetical protein
MLAEAAHKDLDFRQVGCQDGLLVWKRCMELCIQQLSGFEDSTTQVLLLLKDICKIMQVPGMSQNRLVETCKANGTGDMQCGSRIICEVW